MFPLNVLFHRVIFDAESAEDFEVFDAQGWTIGEFKFEIGLVGSEPAMVDIRVYPDANGQPGEPALCSYDGVAATLHGFEQPVLRVPLPTACSLGQGRYWVSVVRSDGSGMSWADGLPNPFPPPFVLGSRGHWRNPGDGFGTGCTDWSDITTCLVEGDKGPVPIGGSGEQFKFQICGVVGLDGSPVGCPAEVVSSNLAITLAVDNGDPGQCGNATTLEVNAGAAREHLLHNHEHWRDEPQESLVARQSAATAVCKAATIGAGGESSL